MIGHGRLVIGLLVVWCVMGASATLAVLSGPNVWWNGPHDLEWLLTTSLPRVLGVFVPPVIYLAVAGIQRYARIRAAPATSGTP